MCGRNPQFDNEEPNDHYDLTNVDLDLFENIIKPSIISRCPSFENLKVSLSYFCLPYHNLIIGLLQLERAFAGHIDYNYVDESPIIGNHPQFRNFHFFTGFSGRGLPKLRNDLMDYNFLLYFRFTTIFRSWKSFCRIFIRKRNENN